MTTNEAIEKYRSFIFVTKTKATMSYYEFYFRLAQSFLGQVECGEVTSTLLLSYISWLRNKSKKISNASINKAIGAIKVVVKHATGLKIEFAKLREHKVIIHTIKENSVEVILSKMENNKTLIGIRNYLIVLLLLDTGLRLSELINIKASNVANDLDHIKVTMTKTDEERVVFFSFKTKKVLKKWLSTRPDFPNLLLDPFKLVPMSVSSIESLFYRIKRKCKLADNITPHKWRHTFATSFLRQGGDLETLRLLLGHTNLKTTQKYLHLSQDDLRKKYFETMR